MKVQGTIIELFEIQQISDTFRNREFVVEVPENNPQYTQKLLLQFIQDKVSILDSYKVGDSVEVSINLKGRAWTNPQGETRYFNSIECWRLEKVGGSDTPAQPVTVAPESVSLDGNDGDLPF